MPAIPLRTHFPVCSRTILPTRAGHFRGAVGARRAELRRQRTLAEKALRQGIPVQNLGLLAQIGTPIAQLGQQGTTTTNGTQDLSGVQQFNNLAGRIGNLLKGISGFQLPSDRRLKEDIAVVGSLFDGTPVYRYRYKGAPAYHIGLMAQDVEQSTPGAVVEINGYKAVDYRAATEASRKLHEAA